MLRVRVHSCFGLERGSRGDGRRETGEKETGRRKGQEALERLALG